MSAAVHAWPVITLTFGDGQVVADATGEVLTYPVLDEATSHEVAADAAAEACRRLGLKKCRVQGHTGDGTVYEMVVDAVSGTLQENQGPAVPAGASTGRVARSAGARGGRRGRNVLIWGSLAVLVATAGVTAVDVFQEQRREQATAVSIPPPAQLPVPAPAGWDTYAAWATPMPGPQVRAVLDEAGRPVSVNDTRLIGHDPATGVEQWSRTAPFTVTQVGMFTLQDQVRLAAATTRELVLFTEQSPDPARVDVPQDGTVVLDGGTVPRVDLPNQRSLVVTADGGTLPRVVPAAAEPVEALGEDLIAADPAQGKVWRIGTDSAALPQPATLAPPTTSAELTGILGCVDGRVVAAWRDDQRTLVGFYDVGEAIDVTTVAQVAVRELEGGPLSGSAVQTDRAHDLLLASSALIDVQATTVHRLPSTGGRLSAGYAWVNVDGGQARINPAGETEQSTRAAQAAVPDVITANGLAMTRVEGAADGSLYALVQHGPTPTPSPTATSEETDR